MLKKLLKPKNFPAVMWLFSALGSDALMLFSPAPARDEKGRKTNIYKLGNHAAFVTNKKPKSAAADSVKSFFAKNI